VRSIVRAMAGREAGPGLTAINAALDAGADPRQLARQVVEYLRGTVLTRLSSAASLDVAPEVRAEMAGLARVMAVPVLLKAMSAFQKAAAPDGRGSWQPSLPLEMALIETCEERGDPVAPQGAIPAAREPAASPPPRPPGGAGPPRPTTKTTPAPSASPTPSPASPAPTFAEVRSQWPQVLAAAFRRDPRTQALLNSGRPMGMERGVLVLGFNSDLLRERMERKENLALVRQSFEDVFGVPLMVRCVLSHGWTPAEEAAPAADAIEDGGMVATAVRDLGAQVVDVKPLSPEGS
jgi:DNA polymerase-3 subunit gamma/tau